MFYSRKSRFRENNMVRPIEKFPFVLVRSTIIGSMRTSGQNWNCLDKIEGQILSGHLKFLSCLRCPHSNFQSGQILSTALPFLCRAHRNIEHFGGIMDHVQILVLVACFVLLNLAQIADETLLMVCLFLRHQFLRNQAARTRRPA